MESWFRNILLLTFFLLTLETYQIRVLAQYFQSERDENTVFWCTVNLEEQKKCETISQYLKDYNVIYGNLRSENNFDLKCNQTSNKDECMILIDNNIADLTTLDPGELFVGGRYHSLVPILEEQYRSGPGSRIVGNNEIMYGVAVIPKSLYLRSLRDLRGKKACFAGVGTLGGWVLPIQKLLREGEMEVIDCNNHVKSALEYFGPSCSVNSLSDKYNPLGDNSDKLCQICGSDYPGVRCTSNDPYAGYEGALSCLLDKGEIAFVKHTTVNEYFKMKETVETFLIQQTSTTRRPFPFDQDYNNNFRERPQYDPDDPRLPSRQAAQNTPQLSLAEFKAKYELLCPNGDRRNIEDWENCYWGELPAHVIVTSSAKPSQLRLRYQRFIQNLVQQIGSGSQPQQPPIFSNQNTVREPPKLFESVPRYGNRSNLLFQDATVSLRSIPEQDQTYSNHLGSTVDQIIEIRSCPIGRATLCVTSEAELLKCRKMKTALNAQLLKPDLSCYKGHSHLNCMQAIRNGDADFAVLDAGDVYKAGLGYELVPIMAEIYNLGKPEYYAVAVAYQGDAETELTYLKGKRSCHSGIGHGAGWVIPMAYLLSSGRMRSYGCDSLLAASQYFTKSCVPGALSKENNFGRELSNLCDLCHGSSFSYCNRNAAEDFYGYTGALRCLIEGGGQVAFVKHTTVSEVADGKRKETWARNILSADYELLCRDGTRAPVTEYERCNLGKVKGNAVVIRGGIGYNETEANAIINLLLYAQQFYGRKLLYGADFEMFSSPAPYSDLIFQDAAQQLQILPPEQRHYHRYLDKTFLRNIALVDCRAAGASLSTVNFILIIKPIFKYLLGFSIVHFLVGRL